MLARHDFGEPPTFSPPINYLGSVYSETRRQTKDAIRVLHKSEKLFDPGDKFQALFLVCSGMVKCHSCTYEGVEQVEGFYLPGEVIGMDALFGRLYQTTATALQTTSVKSVQLEDLSQGKDSIMNLAELMSRKIQHDHKLHLMLSHKTAEQRIAYFLLDMSLRFNTNRSHRTEIRLPMVRSDIASYLGLAVETASRALTKLQKQSVIEIDGKVVKLLDEAALVTKAGV